MRRKLLYILLLVLAFAGTAKGDQLGYSREHPLIFGLDMDYPPMQYVDNDGIPQGYDVVFTQELMKRLNIPFTYAPNTWSNISDDVLSGRVDLAMMVYSPYRKNITNYSRAVFRLYYQIVYRNTSKGDDFDIRNLGGKRVAYMPSRPITDTLKHAGAILNVINDLSKAFSDLSNGKYDAVICFRYQAKYHIRQLKLSNLTAEDLTLTPREYCYVSHNRELIDAINKELVAMEKDGTITDTYDIVSHFGGFQIPQWVWYALALLVLCSLLGFIFMQQKHQERLRREMERAQRSEQLKTVFLGNVSHALRTPLNAIIGFSEVLQAAGEDGIPHENRMELLSLINSNGQQLLYFINELLQLSNIEGNELEFNRVAVQVGQLLREFRGEFESQLEPGVELVVADPPYKLTALLDMNLMRQVVTAMLSNAVKHTHQGRITISYEAVDHGMRIDVRDTGDGVPESLRGNIFGLLTDKNTFVQQETPGLGLSICKAIVDRCHGKIGYEPMADGGSLFWHWVPCKTKVEH